MRKIIALCGALMLASGAAHAQTSNYTATSIVTSSKDPRLVNPWGLSHSQVNHNNNNQWWAADQGTGLSTLYAANGNITGLAVSIPPASGQGLGSPTGTANNPAALIFAFVTLDGTLSIWDANQVPSTRGQHCYECHVNFATVKVNNSAAGASYQGVTLATNATSGSPAYYVANANGGVEAYDAASYSPVTLPAGAFTDARIPAAYTPAGIQAVGGKIFVTYNANAGGGTGYVDAFDTNGELLMRLQNGWFNQPWGVALAPASFGNFSNKILVGNTGSGWIGAYNKRTGAFEGFLQSGGTDLFLPNLWAIEFGDGTSQSGPIDVLYFNSGGPDQTTGVFGSIKAN